MFTLGISLKLRDLVIEQLLCVEFCVVEFFKKLYAGQTGTPLFFSISAFNLHIGSSRAVFAKDLVANSTVMMSEIELEIFFAIGAAGGLLIWNPLGILPGLFLILYKE